MTSGKKLKTTLASLKGCHADFETFALETENQVSKQMFSQFADQTKSMVEGLESRVKEVEEQEPQYQGR